MNTKIVEQQMSQSTDSQYIRIIDEMNKGARPKPAKNFEKLVLYGGYCVLCDLENMCEAEGNITYYEPPQRAHVPFPRCIGEEIHMLCNRHNLEATNQTHGYVGARQKLQIKGHDRNRKNAPNLLDVQGRMDELTPSVENSKLILFELQRIRTNFRLSVEQFKVYSLMQGRALYRINKWKHAYDLLRHANEVQPQKTPLEIQLQLQLEMANCLRRLGHHALSTDIYYLTAHCSAKACLPLSSNPSLDPRFRLSEMYVTQEMELPYQEILNSIVFYKPEQQAHFFLNQSRFYRGNISKAAIAQLNYSVNESSEWQSHHRKSNYLQTLAIHNPWDNEAPTELEKIAKEWKIRGSPFHEALAYARAGVCWIGIGIERSIVHASELNNAHHCFSKAMEVFRSLNNDEFINRLAQNINVLEETFPALFQKDLDIIEYLNDTLFLEQQAPGLFTPNMPGPILIKPGEFYRFKKKKYSEYVKLPTNLMPILLNSDSKKVVFYRKTKELLLNWF